MRNSKSISAINRNRNKQESSRLSTSKKPSSVNEQQAKQRSRSVDTRFKTLNFFFNTTSQNQQTVNSFDLETGVQKSKKLFTKNKSQNS